MDEQNRVAEATAADEVVASADDDAASVETAEDTPPTEEAAGEAGPPEASEPEQDDERKRNRKTARERIAELTRQRREAEERARKAEEALQKAKRPDRLDFEDEASYEEARDDWLYNRRRAREERERAQEAAQTISREVIDDYQSHARAFAAQAPDYDAVAHTAPISDPVANLIAMMGEDGPRVAYALGKDHALARELSAMPPQVAAMELGRMAATMRRPQPRVQSKAPPPVAPVTSGGGVSTKDPGDMSPSEYRAWFASQKR